MVARVAVYMKNFSAHPKTRLYNDIASKFQPKNIINSLSKMTLQRLFSFTKRIFHGFDTIEINLVLILLSLLKSSRQMVVV